MGDKQKQRLKSVMVAGHVCLDITPVFPQNVGTQGLGDILAPGKLINVGNADIHAGGAVANTGLSMKILGTDVTLAGKIGMDQFGQVIKGIFEEYGCADGLVETESFDTSYSVVIAIPGIDRIFLHNPGANHAFCAEDITEQMLVGISHFHLGYPPLMRGLYLNEGRELVTLLKKVKQAGITTSLDMAAIDPESEAAQADWGQILNNSLPYVDFFMPSIEELAYIMDRNMLKEWQARAGCKDITSVIHIENDVRPLAGRLLGMGAKMLFIKCGVLGIYFRTASGASMQALCDAHGLAPSDWVGKEGFAVSYHQPMLLSATGAGDTSIAAFLTAMLEGKSLSRCVQLAAATGACCLTALDALGGLAPLHEIEERIDAGWAKKSEGVNCGCIKAY